MSHKELYRAKISTSYGFVVYTYDKDEIKFLMTLRRDTFCYECLIRGIYNSREIMDDYISHITREERDRLLKYDFDMLWKDLWVSTKRRLYRVEYKKAKDRFEYNYSIIMNQVRNMTTFRTVMWEFPKGKIMSDETTLQCALREFEEETNLNKKSIIYIKQAGTYEDYFIGNDGRKYQSIYYLGYIDKGTHTPFKYQTCPHNIRNKYVSDEVMSIEWLSYKDALEKCPPTKQEILHTIYKYVHGN